MFAELIKYRELLYSLTLREIRVRYKQSLLGVLWALFVPLSMMLIFTFVFTKALKFDGKLDLGGMPYAVFAYIGLLPWTFFSASLTGAVNSLVANQTLVTRCTARGKRFPSPASRVAPLTLQLHRLSWSGSSATSISSRSGASRCTSLF